MIFHEGHLYGVLDAGIAVRDLASVADKLRASGFDVACHEPDARDSLGGVIDVCGPFGLVQIVNFGERFPAVIESGLEDATLPMLAGGSLRIIPLANLVALKLYAGGMKSKADVVEVLRRNPAADRDHIREMCLRYRLGGLEPLIREANGL